MKKIFLMLFLSTITLVNSYSVALGYQVASMGQIWTNGENGGYGGNFAMNFGLTAGFGSPEKPSVLWGIDYTMLNINGIKSPWGLETHLDFNLFQTSSDVNSEWGIYFYIHMGAGASYTSWGAWGFHSTTMDFAQYRYSNIDVVGRLPLGVRFVNTMNVYGLAQEVFMELVPYMGIGMTTSEHQPDNKRFIGSVGIAIGYRYWF